MWNLFKYFRQKRQKTEILLSLNENKDLVITFRLWKYDKDSLQDLADILMTLYTDETLDAILMSAKEELNRVGKDDLLLDFVNMLDAHLDLPEDESPCISPLDAHGGSYETDNVGKV